MARLNETPNPSEKYWNEETIGNYSFDASNVGEFGHEHLQFQSIGYNRPYDGPISSHYQSIMNPLMHQSFQRECYTPGTYSQNPPEAAYEEIDEPPLLEELGIDPNRIFEKTVLVLNPFHHSGPNDANFLLNDRDLAGPLAFCVVMAACFLLSGGKAQFGYVYGLAVTSCILMYVLLNLMTTTNDIAMTSVASVLGYCLLPVVLLSAVGVFISLCSAIGVVLSLLSVICCSESASRLFVMMMGGTHQKPLVAYPCALLYAGFVLIAIF